MSKYKSVSLDEEIKKLQHEQSHLSLLKQYKQLEIITISQELMFDNGSKETNLKFLATPEINKCVDQIDFYNIDHSGDMRILYAFPYKILDITCPSCDYLFKIYSNPIKIPLLLVRANRYYGGDRFIYSLAYRDFIQSTSMSVNIVAQINVKIWEILQQLEDDDKTKGIDNIFITSDINNMKIFT